VIVAKERHELKLGKGVAFVKTQFRRLRQEDETWEADFFAIPCSDGRHDSVWWGIVLSHSHDKVLAQRTVEEPPTVNDLACLLAEAMRRPLVAFLHRARILYLRARPEWAELLTHLEQIGIKVMSQAALPKWDRTFGDLQAQVEQARVTAARRKPMARSKKPAEKPTDQDKVPVYTLEVFLLSGPITEKFAKKNSVISRTIQKRGDQTLEHLHHAISTPLAAGKNICTSSSSVKDRMTRKHRGTCSPMPSRWTWVTRNGLPVGWIRPLSIPWAWKWAAVSATGLTSEMIGGTRLTWTTPDEPTVWLAAHL
jgi:hypothetical protein